jgi:hypothetical protein
VVFGGCGSLAESRLQYSHPRGGYLPQVWDGSGPCTSPRRGRRAKAGRHARRVRRSHACSCQRARQRFNAVRRASRRAGSAAFTGPARRRQTARFGPAACSAQGGNPPCSAAEGQRSERADPRNAGPGAAHASAASGARPTARRGTARTDGHRAAAGDTQITLTGSQAGAGSRATRTRAVHFVLMRGAPLPRPHKASLAACLRGIMRNAANVAAQGACEHGAVKT